MPRDQFVVSRRLVAEATAGSFRLGGIQIQAEVVRSTISHHSFGHLRSRLQQRIRNHAGIFYQIERQLRLHVPLKVEGVIQWYTRLSAGLSTTMLAEPKVERLSQIVERINSPHPRVGPALNEIADTYFATTRDILIPSFGGILARLLLHYHLGRCGLRPVVLDGPDAPQLLERDGVLATLTRRLELSYNDIQSVRHET